MGFQLVAYEKLKSSIRQNITDLLKAHKIDPETKDAPKSLPEPRAFQAQFLLMICLLLDTEKNTHDDKTKSTVLNAATLLILEEILSSYTDSWLAKNPESSTFFNLLKNSLGVSVENKKIIGVSTQEKLTMYTSLQRYIREQLYVKAENPPEGYKRTCPFVQEKLTKETAALLLNLMNKCHGFKVELIQEAEKQHAVTSSASKIGFYNSNAASGSSSNATTSYSPS